MAREEAVGKILQRGGEELWIEKADDRFTISPVSPGSTPAVQEVRVDPSQRDAAMEAARQQAGVAYASHVYQVADDPQSLIYLTDQLTVQFRQDLTPEQQQRLIAPFGLEFLRPVEGIAETYIYRLTAQSRENPVKIANRLMERPEILTAEPNIILQQTKFYRPSDSLYAKQWYLQHSGGNQLAAGSHISIESAWDVTRGVRSIVVAVTDDGFDLNHPDLQGLGKIVAPKDFNGKDFLPLPDGTEENHGTACAGVAVAEENGSGIVGVAPGCALMPLRTTGYLDDESIEQLFDWCLQQGADVISCSWGASAVYFPLSLRQRAAITRAATQGRKGKGCVIVFAAGNANRPISGAVNERDWPNNLLKGSTNWLSGFAVHPDVIAVSASTSLGKKSAYSNWGMSISVCAPSNNAPPGLWFPQTGYVFTAPALEQYLPGLGILTSDRLAAAGYASGDFTNDFGGTSSACPVVAGVAALVLSVNPDLTATQVKQVLQSTADKIVDTDPDPQLQLRLGTYDERGYSQWFGYGKVNALKAVQAAQQMKASLQVTQSFHGTNDQKMAIPDNQPQGVTSGITVGDGRSLKDIQVKVSLQHSFLGDVEIRLIPPRGETILLQGRTLGSLTQLQATYTPTTTPALRSLLNLSVQGLWQVQVVDRSPQDTGTLQGWELLVSV